MWAKLAAWWNSLPHGVQAVMVAFGGAGFGVLWSAAQQWAGGQPVCATGMTASVCAKGLLVSAIRSGIVAVAGLYVKSSLYLAKK